MRHGILVCAFVLAAGLLLNGDLSAGSLEPPGPPAPTMKTLSQVEARTPISSLPFTISAPGSYYLTGDVTGVSGQPGINVQASHVTLDLNGFSLIGVPGSGNGVNAVTFGRNLVIRNGVIRSWGAEGITADNRSVLVEDVRLDSNTFSGMIVGAQSIVRNTIATQNGGVGITTGANSEITGCTATGNSAATGLEVGANSVVSHSVAAGNLTGITLGTGSTANGCTSQSNTTGFDLRLGSRVVHSVARANATGFLGADYVSIEECTADTNTGDGIRVTTRALVRGNVVRGNGGDGIQATSTGNRIEDNEVAANVTGIRADAGAISNLIVKNSAYLNGTEYSIVAGNQFATPSVNPNTAGPWANFDL